MDKNMLEKAGIGCNMLRYAVKVVIACNRLELAGIGWNKLEYTGIGWYRLE